MTMDGPAIVAVAALAGSLIGGCSSVAAAFIGQRVQARWRRLGAELEERERLYGLFIEEAVRLFIDSIQQSHNDPVKIMRLYSKVARIRLTSSNQVLQAAEKIAKKVLESYEQPPDNPVNVLARFANGQDSLDPLREFAEACREERARLVDNYGDGVFGS
jgi:hypothetical protein